MKVLSVTWASHFLVNALGKAYLWGYYIFKHVSS